MTFLVEVTGNWPAYPPYKSVWRVMEIHHRDGTDYYELEGLVSMYDANAFRVLDKGHVTLPGWRKDWAKYCKRRIW